MPIFVSIAVAIVGAKVAVAGYLWKHRWLSYDPAWLIALAREQLPGEEWLVKNLARCTRAKWENDYYLKFKSYPPHRHDKLLLRNHIVLIDPANKKVILNVRTDGYISGVTFHEKYQGQKKT